MEFLKSGKFIIITYPKLGEAISLLSQDLRACQGMTGCTAQLSAYNELFDEFSALGFSLLAVGSKSEQDTQKFASSLGAKFRFLSDEQLALAKMFDLKTFQSSDGKSFYFRQSLILDDFKVLFKRLVSEPADDARLMLVKLKELGFDK